jgi:phosphate uptake regulator
MNARREGETRKLQITGGSTYILSMPKKWVKTNRLGKGSLLSLTEEENGSLSILPLGVKEQERQEETYIKVSPKEDPDKSIRKLVSAYLVGYSLIHVKSDQQQAISSRQRTEMKAFARRLLVGTEIVTDTPTELALQVLLSFPELSVQSALRRMSIITVSMHKDAVTALENLDYQLAREAISTDNEVDRFNMYVIRQLKTAIQDQRTIREIGLTSARDCLGYRLITKSVERTADHAASIAENVLSIKKTIDMDLAGKIKQMSEIAVSMFENSVEALFKQDYDLAESIIERTKQVAPLEKEVIRLSQKNSPEESTHLRLIIESLRRTAEYASDISEIVLNLTVESVMR